MGVRPPSNDSDDDPESIEFGIAALDARFDELQVSFPVSVDELDAEYGEMRVPVDPAGNDVRLGEVLAECPRERFESEQEMLNVLHPIFERKREAIGNSLIGRLRALVPF